LATRQDVSRSDRFVAGRRDPWILFIPATGFHQP
jgi:hypothetical protein